MPATRRARVYAKRAADPVKSPGRAGTLPKPTKLSPIKSVSATKLKDLTRGPVRKASMPAAEILTVPTRRSAEGEVWVFGNGDAGQLGLGEDLKDAPKPRRLPDLRDKHIVDLAVGAMHTLALAADGTVYSWGCNDEGALGRQVADGDECDVDVIPDSKKYNFVRLAAGDSISLGLTAQGEIYAWGNFRADVSGQLGFSHAQRKKQLTPLPLAQHEPLFKKHRFVAVAAGANHALALTTTGKVVAWGSSEQGQCGFLVHHIEGGLRPRELNFGKNTKIVAVACGNYHSLCIDAEGDLWTFGLNNAGQCGQHESVTVCPPSYIYSPALEHANVVAVEGGEHHTLALLSDGRVLAFGKNTDHELGLGFERLDAKGQPTSESIFYDFVDPFTGETRQKRESTFSIHVPWVNPFLHSITDIAAGTHHNLAIDRAGDFWFWGNNTNGQCGAAQTLDDDDVDEVIKTPHKFKAKTQFRTLRVGAGAQHSVILIEPPASKPAPAAPNGTDVAMKDASQPAS